MRVKLAFEEIVSLGVRTCTRCQPLVVPDGPKVQVVVTSCVLAEAKVRD